MSDDITYTHGFINPSDLQSYVLYEIELIIRTLSPSSSLSDYSLPLPSQHLIDMLNNKLLMEEKNYDRVALKQQRDTMLLQLNGDAIEGKCEINDTHIYSSFKEDSCYKIEGHICTAARSSGRLTDHEASILIAKRAKFHPIAERPIPRSYYNFATNDMLESREKSYNKLLTDYLGLIQTASNVYKQRDYNLMKIKLQDQEGYTVMLTLWEKIAFAFNTENVIGKVLAVTSAKVTKHLDTYQLESTESTTLQVDPPIENLQEIRAKLKHIQANKISNPGVQLALSNTEPVLSIAELKMKSTAEYKNKKYTFQGRIKEFEEYRGWFTSKCTALECTSKLHKEKRKADMYCVNTIIMDSSGTISAVIYNDDMQEILGMSCKTLVVDKGFDNSKKLPPVLLSLIGKLMTFTIRLRENVTPVIQNAVEIESTTAGTIEQQLLTAAPKTPAKTNVRARDQTEEAEAQPSKRIRFTIKSWKRFADHYGITVNQKVQLAYDFQTDTLFVHREI
ncbi:hypothetical protein SSX86_031817 [Deinandra increscens subsp. villosa]|uniref:Uncharacterized protein n=1 Tax=Deinandra increscens subsp. villosa TaxID=3103831 RepID=A0AAP0GHC0_9ASTR